MATNVGSVEIDAKIDTSALDRGMLRMEMDLNKIKGKMKGFEADLSGASTAAIGLSTALAGVAIDAVGSMVKLASTSPAVAGAVAQMDVEMGKFSRTSGQIFKPAFDLAADALSGFNNFLEENQEELSGAVDTATGFVRQVDDVWNALVNKPAVENLKDFVEGLRETLENPLSLKFDINWGKILGGSDQRADFSVGKIPSYFSNPGAFAVDVYEWFINNMPTSDDMRQQLLSEEGR